MSLILKSNSVFVGDELVSGYSAYINRVTADGGVVFSKNSVVDALIFAMENNLNVSNCFSATSINWGYKEVGGKVVKLYNLFNPTGDLIVRNGDFIANDVSGKRGLYINSALSNVMSSQGTTKNHETSLVTAFKEESVTSDERYFMGISARTYNPNEVLLRIGYYNGNALSYYGSNPTTTLLTPTLDRNYVQVYGAGYVGDKSVLVKGAELANQSSTNLPTMPADGWALFLGRAYGIESTDYSLQGWSYETWCVQSLSNVEAIKKIGARLQHIYA